MTSDEWNAGYDAYMAGYHIGQNPFPSVGHYFKWSDWRAGWNAAREHKTWD